MELLGNYWIGNREYMGKCAAFLESKNEHAWNTIQKLTFYLEPDLKNAFFWNQIQHAGNRYLDQLQDHSGSAAILIKRYIFFQFYILLSESAACFLRTKVRPSRNCSQYQDPSSLMSSQIPLPLCLLFFDLSHRPEVLLTYQKNTQANREALFKFYRKVQKCCHFLRRYQNTQKPGSADHQFPPLICKSLTHFKEFQILILSGSAANLEILMIPQQNQKHHNDPKQLTIIIINMKPLLHYYLINRKPLFQQSSSNFERYIKLRLSLERYIKSDFYFQKIQQKIRIKNSKIQQNFKESEKILKNLLNRQLHQYTLDYFVYFVHSIIFMVRYYLKKLFKNKTLKGTNQQKEKINKRKIIINNFGNFGNQFHQLNQLFRNQMNQLFGNKNQSDQYYLEQINRRNKLKQGFQKLIIWEKQKQISLIKITIQKLMSSEIGFQQFGNQNQSNQNQSEQNINRNKLKQGFQKLIFWENQRKNSLFKITFRNLMNQKSEVHQQSEQSEQQQQQNLGENNQYLQLLEDIQEIIENQMFILDSIHRRPSYNTLLGKIWRYQLNSLSQYQRFLIYDQLRQLKSFICQLKFLNTGISQYLVIQQPRIWKIVKDLLDLMKCDIEIVTDNVEKRLNEDFVRIVLDGDAQILIKTQNIYRRAKLPILKDVIDVTLKILDFTFWISQRLVSCKLCTLKNARIGDFFSHLLMHFEFLHLFDANMGRCIDNKCKSKKDHKKAEYNLREHTFEQHSKCYLIEKSLRYCIISQEQVYGNSWKQYQNFKNDVVKVLGVINPQYQQQFIQEYGQNKLKGAAKENCFRLRIKDALLQMNNYWELNDLELFDNITIYLTTTWRKLFEDQITVQDERIPLLIRKLFGTCKIPYYNQQVNIMNEIIKGSQLESLKVKLFFGYFNCSITFGEFEYLIKDIQEGLYGIAIFNTLLSGKLNRINRQCIFNDITCDEKFEKVEDILKHYCKAHFGIISCIANEKCELLKDQRIDTWMEHCHDFHKDDFVSLISNYLKQQKAYFQFKAVCQLCKINIQSLTDIYWNNDPVPPKSIWNMEIRVQWKHLIKSYKDEKDLDDHYMIAYQESYERYKTSKVRDIKANWTYHNNGKIAVCKKCKYGKQQMPHLKREQFTNRKSNKLFQLVKLEGRITRKSSDTFFRVIGNLNALKEKPHIFFEGTDIMYQWNSTQAKKQFKCKLMDKSKAERIDYVNACKNHAFLINHTYQMTDLSQQLLRQEKQLLEINRNLWMTYLDKQEISNAKDKLQLEFAKLQDMLLFDGLLHRTSVLFVCSNMRNPFPNWIIQLRIFLSEETVQNHPFKNKCQELLDQFEMDNGQDQRFWEITMLNYLICEQRDDNILDFQQTNNFDHLSELILMNKESNAFGYWFRHHTQQQVRAYIDYAIHPIYMGAFYQIIYENYQGKNRMTQKQKTIVQMIFQAYSIQIIDTCLINHGYTTPDQNNTVFQASKYELKIQQQYLLHELVDLLDDQQFIDMQGRVAIVIKAYEDTLKGNKLEEIMPSDLRWTVQVASIFISSLKAQRTYFHPGQDRELRIQHMKIMEGMQDEIEYFYATNDPVYKKDFLTTTYREMIQEIVDNEIFPIQQSNGRQIRQYTQEQISKLSKYENLRKLHFVYWIPVEQKLKNLLVVHKVIRELVDKEPYFQMSQQFNVTSFYKDLEYAMFPHLYPNAKGGLISKMPEVKNFQLMIDLIEQEKLLAPQHLQQLAQIRQNVVTRQIDRNQLMNSNQLNIEIALIDFNVKEQFGNTTFKPTKAIYKFLKQPIINSNQSLAFIFELQQLAPLQYEQQRHQLQQNNDEEWILPQIADVQLQVNNQIGSDSVLENHVSQNLDKYLRKSPILWDNEQQQFIKQNEKEIEKLKRNGKTTEEIEAFLMLQKKLLIQTKIQQLSKNNQLIRALDQIRNTHILQLDDSITTSESEDEIREQERIEQEERAMREVNQFNRQVLNDVLERQQQQQLNIIQTKILQKEVLELIDLDKQKVDLSLDTKFKMKCSYTQNFSKDHKWILWRYYEWIKSQFYCYQKIVNKEKGMMVYQQGELKRFTSIPPICGSETELQEKYKEIRAYCFQEGPPLIMLTITTNEFDEKTFKVMRGLNFFDLEDESTVIQAEKKITRDDDINQNANLYVEYYIYLVDHLLRVIQNKYAESQINPDKHWNKYQNGLFGKLKAFVKRIEFQERGSIHFHILLFLQTNEEGQFDEKLLLFFKGMLSLFRMNIQKDKDFVQKYNLLHKCNANRCTKAEDQKCREGYPFKITYGYVYTDYPIEIKQRRLTLNDSNVISTWKLLVRYFNSNVQIQMTADERIISYVMKYINKKNTNKDSTNEISEENQENLDQEEKQLMEIVRQFYKDKTTHLQEACLAFQSEKLIETNYKVVKINQRPLSRQQQNDQLEELTQDNIQNYLNRNNQSNVWNRYLRRPQEFEFFNLIEFINNCLHYGKKQIYIQKFNKERENNRVHIEDYKYFLDLDGCVVKLKELNEYKVTVIVKTLLHSTKEQGGTQNIFFLEMLQLYWPHRYQDWIRLTRDNFEGYEEAYERLMETFTYDQIVANPLAAYFKKKYCKFQDNPLMRYTDLHNNIQIHQKRMLEVMYRFKFNLQYGENNENNLANLDFLLQVKHLLRQQLDLEFGYWRVNQIRKVLEIFNPEIKNAEQELLDEANLLLEQLTQEVSEHWIELPLSTQNIIKNVAHLYKYYGCPEINQEILKHTQKLKVSKANATGKDFNLSQLQLIRQEEQEMEIPFEKPRNTQISEEIPLSVLIQENLQDFHIKFEEHFRNKLTIEEHKKTKVQRKITQWNLDQLEEGMETSYQNLNLQQRLAFIMMICNLTMTFKELEPERRFEGTFIHGPGGVGKSHIIATMVKFANNFHLNYDILCPTQFAVQNIIKMCQKIGIEEINVQTIHSFFKLRIDQGIKSHIYAFREHIGRQGVQNFTNTTEIFQKFFRFQFYNFSQLVEIFKELDLIIIEEVSMMDPDFLTLLDIYAQISRQCAFPFGGIQVFLFGDSFQLQPVMQGKINYFDTHVLKSGYFSHMIELTQSVRQQDDLEYFEKILQPIRFGTFGEDTNNFYDQIKQLENRIVPQNLFGINQNIKSELENKKNDHQQVISLYFKNDNVDFENEKRALQIIQMIDEKRLKGRFNDKKRFRQYIKQPIQFRWNNQRTQDDQMALLLGQKFEFKKEVYEANFNHQTHYLMLPIGIRNYLAKQLGQIAYRIALKQDNLNKAQCLKELVLFENEEIIIRKNLNKQENLINGQFASIKALEFDVDYMNPYNMRQLERDQYDYLKTRNYFDMIEENKTNAIRFSDQDKKEMNKVLEDNKLMNINYLDELDLHQSEKGLLYLKDVDPRLQKIILKIGETQMTDLEIGDKAFQYSINVSKADLIRTLTEVEDSLIATYEFMKKTLQMHPIWAQAALRIRKWLIENLEMELFGIDYINGQFGLEYLERSIIHMKFLIKKLPNTCQVQISQIPINLGYARTIHCAQGSTFDNVVMDLDMPERQQSGLLYTALSRVRRISNLYLSGKFDQNLFKVRVSKEIKKFFEGNIIEVTKYLQNEELKKLLEKDFKLSLKMINEMASDIRQAMIQLKQEQMNIPNH